MKMANYVVHMYTKAQAESIHKRIKIIPSPSSIQREWSMFDYAKILGYEIICAAIGEVLNSAFFTFFLFN